MDLYQKAVEAGTPNADREGLPANLHARLIKLGYGKPNGKRLDVAEVKQSCETGLMITHGGIGKISLRRICEWVERQAPEEVAQNKTE